jgi:hypothetical protein
MWKNILWMAGGLAVGLAIWAIYDQMQKAKARKAADKAKADAAAALAAGAGSTTTTTAGGSGATGGSVTTVNNATAPQNTGGITGSTLGG